MIALIFLLQLIMIEASFLIMLHYAKILCVECNFNGLDIKNYINYALGNGGVQ